MPRDGLWSGAAASPLSEHTRQRFHNQMCHSSPSIDHRIANVQAWKRNSVILEIQEARDDSVSAAADTAVLVRQPSRQLIALNVIRRLRGSSGLLVPFLGLFRPCCRIAR